MPTRARYSQWDGTQDIPPLDPDDVLAGLTDDLMNFGDLEHALRNMLQRGMRTPSGSRTQGLRDLLQQLRQQRRQTLDRFDLTSAFDDIQQRIDEILELERDTLDERRDEAQRNLPPTPDPESPDQPGPADQTGQPNSPTSGAPAQPPTPGVPGQPSAPDEQTQFAQMLRDIVDRKQQTLDNLPDDAPGRLRGLHDYEFMNPQAQQKYQELLDSLRQQMLNSFSNDIAQAIQNTSPEDMDRMRDMVHDLNDMLHQRMAGEEPDFDAFMDKYADLFGDNPPQSLDELVEQMQQQAAMMQNLMDSLPGDMRQQLQDLMADRMADAGMIDELSELAANLEALYPMHDLRNQYPFRGDEEIDLRAAMSLMSDMQAMDELEQQLERTQYGGDLDQIDMDRLEELLGEDARQTLDQLKELLEILEQAGYIRKTGNSWALTPRGNRKIGQKALTEIYANLKHQNFGKHNVAEFGRAGERADDSKPYEFGDPFQLDLKQTIMNAIHRGDPGVPVALDPHDFEVYRSETLTQTATVLMLDLSWSMALRGSFQAAKKVALALNNLIRMQYPRDNLYLIGFSATARELTADELPYVRWDESVLGTNMHHALMIAQRLLAKHKTGTRQIVMITDGEPTAHLDERGHSYFAYPPSPITIRKTLQEVKHCTQKDIVINIFMLERSYYLKEFVNQVAKINRGRVFYSTPDQLGEYILVDFVANKRKNLSSA
jgi:uncharacterized protein with von Willebrand factor type A (vWA) domain